MGFKAVVPVLLFILVLAFLGYSVKTYMEAAEDKVTVSDEPTPTTTIVNLSETPVTVNSSANTSSNQTSPSPQQQETPIQQDSSKITQEQAIEIALEEVDGNVTDARVARRYGEIAYVIEIIDDDETFEVIIDIDTGNVIGVEELDTEDNSTST